MIEVPSSIECTLGGKKFVFVRRELGREGWNNPWPAPPGFLSERGLGSDYDSDSDQAEWDSYSWSEALEDWIFNGTISAQQVVNFVKFTQLDS